MGIVYTERALSAKVFFKDLHLILKNEVDVTCKKELMTAVNTGWVLARHQAPCLSTPPTCAILTAVRGGGRYFNMHLLFYS